MVMKKGPVLIVIVVLLVALTIAVLFISGVFSGPSHNLTEFKENLVITSYLSSGSQESRFNMSQNGLAGKYPIGKMFTITVPYTYDDSGNETITSIVCNTPGFSFVSASPSLPAPLDVTLQITFSTPEEAYTGPFEYTVSFDHYP